MEFSKLFSFSQFSPSEEIKKSQNDRIAMEIVEKLSSLIEQFEDNYEDGITIINESLTNLAKKDQELTLAIIEILKEKYSDLHKEFTFKINP